MKQSIRRKGAVTGVAATAAFGLVLAGSVPAIAADYNLGEDDILPYEIGDETLDSWNYNEWHISQTYNADAQLDEYVTFNECSISFNEDPRGAEHHIPVLKGFDIDARPTTANTGDTSEWLALIESIEIEVISGEVTLQLPLFMYWNGDLDNVDFTTVRNAVAFGPGVHTLTGVDLTESQSLIDDEFGPYSDSTELLERLQEGADEYGDIFEILAVGFTGSEGAEVASISFAGDTYYFGTGDCTPVDDVEEEDEVEDEVEDDAGADAGLVAPTPPASVETDA